MRLIKSTLVVCLLALLVAARLGAAEAAATATPVHAEAAGVAHDAGAGAAHAEHEEHGLPSYAVPVLEIGWFKVSNSMIVVWTVALLLVVFAQMASRKMALVPSGLQNFGEWMVEGLYEFIEGIVGKQLVKKSFWFFATIFILILFTNWAGLFPGIGTIGWGVRDTSSALPLALKHVSEPVFRGGNADLNMTAAMAVVSFVLWIIWSVQANGVGGMIRHLFSPGGDNRGVMGAVIVLIFMMVGILEVLSILFRPISLSLRLYGNIFAGENILESMTTLVPWLGWLLPVPFLLLEMLVGAVQALVFTLLTSVYIALMCEHSDDHGSEAKAGAAAAH